MKDVFVLGAMRSPVGNGRKDSSLLGIMPQDLACHVLGALFLKIPVPRSAIESFKLGSVVSLKSSSVTQAFAKETALRAKMFNTSANVTEKACSSGLLAIHQAENAIRNEGCDFTIGLGVDIMSGVPDEVNIAALTDPITKKLMAQLSDEKARELGFTREDYDRYALESYRRAKEHILDYYMDGYLATSLMPGKGILPFSTTYDQNIFYRIADAENFVAAGKIPGCEITTFKNASKNGDGCGALLLASPRGAKKMRKLGVLPIAKILAYAEHTLKESKDFVIAPAGAVVKALDAAKKTNRDIGAWWVNEAFPGVPLAFMNAWGAVNEEILYENLNPWGGAIAFGHPLGATGAILCVNAICQARKEGKKYIVVSLCNAIGEATAMVFEIL